MSVLQSALDTRSEAYGENRQHMQGLVDDLRSTLAGIERGGDERSRKRHEARGKLLAVEISRCRLRPQVGQQPMALQPARRNPVHHSKPPRVGESDRGPVAADEHDMLVLRRRPRIMRELPRRRGIGIDQHAPRHAQMDHQVRSVVEGGEELRRGERGDPREDPRRRRRLRAALLEARHQQREQPGQGAADAEGHLLRRQERVSTRVCSAHARRGV